jgi:two-component system cell cycle response regulator DivK
MSTPSPRSLQPRPESDRQPKAAETPRPLSVLIVDDMPEVRKLYSLYFGAHGLNVFTARDGVEALRAISQEKPDAVVLDMSLPRMTGWELLEKLRADPVTRNLPVVVLTGALFPGACSDAYRSGADAYLTKPCVPAVVLTEIVRLTGGPTPEQA